MGAKDSKRTCLGYDDAVKRMSDIEFKRVCEAFKRLTGGKPVLSQQAFVQYVLGDGVPSTIADSLYTACGGGPRGIHLRDLICGLVLLTKGTKDEKIKFLWNLYSNDACTQINKADFLQALQAEGTLAAPQLQKSASHHLWGTTTALSLFGDGHDRVGYEQFRDWIVRFEDATVLSKWLLTSNGVSLSSELETPTFYQSLAGVTHLEERDICELEKCFWSLQGTSPTGQLDINAFMALVSPPVPTSACTGLFLALDVNRDGHIDFKELCCGISAACRGPVAERTKFCFKIFDVDRDNQLDSKEYQHMIEILLMVMKEHRNVVCKKNSTGGGGGSTLERRLSNEQRNEKYCTKALEELRTHLDDKGCLSQEDFLVWCVEHNAMVAPLLELLFQVCHVSLGLRPKCRHHEHEIVTGWLEREQHRGYRVGQFWYLIANDWWQTWFSFTTAPRNGHDYCTCRPEMRLPLDPAEEIVCDESFTSNSTDYTSHSNEFTSNSTDSMGDLLSRGDSCSIASSSGVSSSSGTLTKRPTPGPIDNNALVCDPISEQLKVVPLTGEGSRLRRDTPLVQGRDFELIPDSLWKALALWYGSPLPLPRQVIKPPGSNEMELELYPLNLKIYRHQNQVGAQSGFAGAPNATAQGTWATVGGYGAAALSSAGISTAQASAPRRFLTHTAAFSRLSNIRQVTEFLAARLALRMEDVRLWLIKDNTQPILLEEDAATLQDLSIVDSDSILLEVRNKDLTWPEELGALACGTNSMLTVHSSERRPTISLPPGATGLHNLGNTCFMNAALQAVSNTRPLTQYFRRDAQLCELNSTNPLGTKGQVAKRYAELCRELWAGSTRSVAPLKLRWCVSKHAPNLGGGGQHDSQELLAWLLDTLHEDLNRVHRKQYTELRDSDGRPDTIVADEAWEQHLARDHSIITDLFYGQLKSKVTCQTCGHESVRFDAFNLLSLPLPMESYTLCEVLVVRLDGYVPIKYGMRLNSEARYIELKHELEKLSGVKASRLLVAEVAYSRIRQMMKDNVRINPATATELYAYELPADDELIDDIDGDMSGITSGVAINDGAAINAGHNQMARSPEVRSRSALCMPNILCFKNARTNSIDMTSAARRFSNGMHIRRPLHSNIYTDVPMKNPTYLVAVHRKCVRQETYFLSQHKSKPSLFGVPLLLGCNSHSTCQSIYEAVWEQVTRLLSPLPQSDQTNHATDCDDSLGYEFPFTLKAVLEGGQICAVCHWTQFCRGCRLPCSDKLLFDACRSGQTVMCVAIDWDPTALHLRYQCSREKVWREHESVSICRKLHTEPIDLDHCLKAFTSEERLEAKYHCGNCKDKQPATKKLQIWRLPPILIVHLKRFDYVNNKWVKTQKVVNFPFRNFDPTAYLASVPQETILRHKQLLLDKRKEKELVESSIVEEDEVIVDEKLVDIDGCDVKLVESAPVKDNVKNVNAEKERAMLNKRRQRLESTSLIKTPIIDEDLQDFHKHKLQEGADPFDLNYQLYAVVSHSGMLNGGHYISYACNPNGNWYCYNDSSCREVGNIEPPPGVIASSTTSALPKIDTSSAYILFYERAGLDYSPYFPDVTCNGGNPQVTGPSSAAHTEDEFDDSESELRKQCVLQ